MASIVIRLSGTTTGTNRLGIIGGSTCANGDRLAESVSLTLGPGDSSVVAAPNSVNGHFSSRWSVNLFSWTRYCAFL